MTDNVDDGLAKIAEVLAEGDEKAARPRVAGIPPADELWWAEPCAGSGNLLRLMPANRRIGFDILPQDRGELGIIRADYQTQKLDPDKRWIVLTNPPFSKGGPQALFQWAAGQLCVCAIGIITPHYFDRPTTINKLNLWFHRIHHDVLDPASFTHNGQKKWSPAIYSLWVRRDYQRDLIILRTEHPDWQWLPASRMGEASAWIQNWGIGVGDLKLPDRLGRIDDPANHLFLKEVRPNTIDRLKTLNLREAGHPSLSAPRLYRDQIVAAYIAAYGPPEPDFGEPIAVDAAPAGPADKITGAAFREHVKADGEEIAEAISPKKGGGKPGRKPLPGDRLVICGDEATGWQVRRIASALFATLPRKQAAEGVGPGLNVGHPVSVVWPTRAGAEVAAKRQAKRLGVPWELR